MTSLPTGTITFLFADIEGSTRLLQQLGDAYADVLADCRRLVRAAVQERGGQEVDTEGDAVFAAFPSAREALMAAVGAQQQILRHPWPDDAAVRVRMGLHTGEARVAEAGYVGMDVHRAARICAAAHGGQILLSDTISALVTKDLPNGVSLRDLGEHRLKDLAHPHRLFQVVTTDLPGDFPSLRSLDAHAHNLPIQLTSFIGRAAEIAEVKRLLGAARLVTLTGSGGAGKTRLALQAAADVMEGYPDGAWVGEFAPIADPALVPKTVASALSVPEQPGREMTDTLVEALRSKALLLVLDNCEHLLAACATLAVALLRACPQVRILATSREPLGVPGETLWRVPSLSLPDIHHLPPSEDLVLYEAVRLFVDRAMATVPGFTVTRENAPAVAQVCQRLDGIPLAIELAAARMKVLAVEQIAARLDDRFRLLTGGSRIVLPRHQTLRAAIDWSYNLLSEPEQVLLRRLSVFAGGWSLEAAESVCAGRNVEAANTLDLLTSLVDKSLVLAETQRGEARYRLLETVRQYAWERLADAREPADIQRRHRDWYLDFAERANAHLRGPREAVWLEPLREEHENLRAAQAWSAEGNGDTETLCRFAIALQRFRYLHGHWSEARVGVEELLKRNDLPPSAMPKLLEAAAHLSWRQGEYEQATALCEKGLSWCGALGDTARTGFFLFTLGIVALHQGARERAKRLLEDAATLGPQTEDKWLTSAALNQLGNVARIQGDWEMAARRFAEALAAGKDAGDLHRIASSVHNLGTVALLQHDYGRAAELFKESLLVCRDVSDRWVAQECLEGLAGVACAGGDYRRAVRLLGTAEALRASLASYRLAADQADFDQRVNRTRVGLGEKVFAALWAEGRAMTLEQAIEYALEGAK